MYFCLHIAVSFAFCSKGSNVCFLCPVRFSYNPYFSACFFSRNSIFLSQQISRNSVSACFSAKRIGPCKRDTPEQRRNNIFPRRYKTINAREQEDVEDVGQDYFHDLHSCAFLQLKRKTSSDFDSGEYFTVHDLLHDLAESVAGSDCVRINRGVIGQIPKYVRHLCIESYNEEAFPEQILELRNLSTLIMYYSVKKISQDDFKCVLMRLKKLRVVQLDVQWMGRIPACIGELRHLRYLGISTPPPCNMTLPTEVTKLYHLQVLSVPRNTLLRCSSKEKNV